MLAKSLQLCSSLCDLWILALRLLYPQDSPGKNTGVGCHVLPLPPGDLPDSGIKPESLTSPALVGGFFTISITWGACSCVNSS